ncbi:VanZ family protein [Streptococcus massiliensis]|uniref:VanZ family protein n=1 Tax=Streptococcus massiliensis TaxID=313439 RepID=A0A380L0Q8_9STRE|nr:VanZ family protein [Streptococcus massiliensis]SUN77466.1 VanZ family protein [Streptococcus massiliensis]
MEIDKTLTPTRRKILLSGSVFYSILLILMCLTPQLVLEGAPETPGIRHFGRLVVLLIPFNSLVNLGQITSWFQLIKVVVQNLANIFLIFPLILQLLFLFPTLRQIKRVLILGFGLSLFIECSQLILDYLWDFNRVFEIDDLWTNTLGAYLALLVYNLFINKRNVRK